MAVRTREEILASIKAVIGEDASDASIELLEDVTDTFDDMAARVQDPGDWENKYNELQASYNQLDADWRARYTARFYDGKTEDDKLDNDDDKTEILHYEDLFTEVD